jgi:hypothetical protein
MTRPDYLINPILMGGLVKELDGDLVKVHLHGRLGVITVPRRMIIENEGIEPGSSLKFFFSYVQITENPCDYDTAGLDPTEEIFPVLIGGKVTEVNDTAVKVEMVHNFGTVAVPRRWVFTDMPLKEGLDAELYISCMHVTGKTELPVESI